MGKLSASFCDGGGPTIVGSDAREFFSNFTPLDSPKKASVRLKSG